MRLFRESVTKNSQLSNHEETGKENIRLTQQYIALKKLTQQWIENGDEKEQTETWEYLTIFHIYFPHSSFFELVKYSQIY